MGKIGEVAEASGEVERFAYYDRGNLADGGKTAIEIVFTRSDVAGAGRAGRVLACTVAARNATEVKTVEDREEAIGGGDRRRLRGSAWAEVDKESEGVQTTSNEEVVPPARLHTVHLTSVEVVHPKNDFKTCRQNESQPAGQLGRHGFGAKSSSEGWRRAEADPSRANALHNMKKKNVQQQTRDGGGHDKVSIEYAVNGWALPECRRNCVLCVRDDEKRLDAGFWFLMNGKNGVEMKAYEECSRSREKHRRKEVFLECSKSQGFRDEEQKRGMTMVVLLNMWVLISNFKLAYNLLRCPDDTFNRDLAKFLDRKVPANANPVDEVLCFDVIVDRETNLTPNRDFCNPNPNSKFFNHCHVNFNNN
ncbi:hypothetical protein V8G54_028892 [Vigna mungo]|uniref:Uncharacterized protein n=1 Tax=Vigna mungo TaxID=3915 RepID=A0AAQ3MTF9_VIGMU